MASPESTVQVRALTRRFGAVEAVSDMSWSANAGQITAVLGPNGAGKTTTIACLEGLLRPDAGEVRVLGTNPWRADATHRARVGVMLQDGGLPTTSTPRRLLAHLVDLYARPLDLPALVTRLGIDSFERTPVRRLSGGQRQRVALAAALIGDPEVLFLDEPSAGLDPHARREVWDLIRETRERGRTLVVTTHSFEEAERLADRIVVVAGGRAVAEGSLEQVSRGSNLESVYFDLTSGRRS
ncbi:ABC transporter ATP-binding protein [Gephyromycinifex aptenodytis]|uniref:ABC transporter ATP-binding protein n=1 Tax=Gephyromycinifex aptenodytis TaxID=2716227 RepID=UPI0014484551|nr:ABC transporter ATP-binding protein [Gephyromycinifex aptenodytis]